MDFRFNANTLTIETENPDIYVVRVGKPYELGLEFLLVWDDRKIGFRTADFDMDDKSERLADGTHVWSFDSIFCVIERPDRKSGTSKKLTNTYALDSKAQVKDALDLFALALSHYDGGVERSAAGNARAKVIFTEKVLRQVEDEKFIR